MDIEEVETVAVLGAGSMGHGIAEVAALAGYEVSLRDIKEEFVEDGMDSIEWSLDKLVEQGQVSREDADAAWDRVEGHVDLEAAVGDADFVIEAVPEKMDVKKNVYRETEQYAPDHAVFATNTSSLSVTEISEVTDRPEQFCGMHFFNPPVRMQLVEVIAGAHTRDDVLELTEDLAESMGKEPVRVRKDSPGFIANRVLVTLLNEAAWLVHEGEATIAEVDSTAKFGIGIPMGAFELADHVGIDVAYHVLEYMHEQLGDAYEPCPLLVEKAEAGELGKKSDEGFYDYDDGGVEIPSDEGRDDVADVLLAVMANEVAKLADDDVADPASVDRAIQLGARFPEGPARLADDAGLESLHETLVERHDETGAARYDPAPGLETRVAGDGGFYAAEASVDADYEAISVSRDGRVGQIELDREHRMNAITLEMLDELVDAVETFEDDEEVRALLVTGAGERAFSAGADVQATAASATPLDGIELSRKGQETFGRIEESDLPVVVAIDGYCLGGGMELAAAGDLRVASDRSELGQTEHNIGLLPAWGGTQRLPRIVGEGRAKEIIFTADHYEAETMADYGFINDVVAPDELDDAARELATDIAAGPPIAQRLTKRAMHAGREDMDAGLEAESMAFGHIVGTDDMMEGVSALMSDREPEFEGH